MNHTSKQILGHDIKELCRGFHSLTCSEVQALLDSVREEYKGRIIDKIEREYTWTQNINDKMQLKGDMYLHIEWKDWTKFKAKL